MKLLGRGVGSWPTCVWLAEHVIVMGDVVMCLQVWPDTCIALVLCPCSAGSVLVCMSMLVCGQCCYDMLVEFVWTIASLLLAVGWL